MPATKALFAKNLLDDEPPLSDYELKQIEESEDDIRNGRVIPWEKARAELEALP